MLLEQGKRPFMFNALTLMNWRLLAQQEKPAGNDPPDLLDMLSGMALPIGMIIVLYIFLMVLPQRREQKKAQEFLSSLKKNDQVILQGGILAKIMNVKKDQDIITVRLDESTNTNMRVLRSSVVKVVQDKGASESGTE